MPAKVLQRGIMEADHQLRVRLVQERQWKAPAVELWPCFEAAVYKLLAEWDVRARAWR